MISSELLLLPGQFILGFILDVIGIYPASIEPGLFTIFAGFISWVFWMSIIRAVWAITLKIFGFQSSRGRF